MTIKERLKFQAEQYGAAAILGLAIAIPLTIYLWFRSDGIDLFQFNRVIGNTALIMLAALYLIGPLVGATKKFAKFLQYRKEIGISAAALAILHGLLSLITLNSRFTFERYLQQERPLTNASEIGIATVAIVIAWILERLYWGRWTEKNKKNITLPIIGPFTFLTAAIAIPALFFKAAPIYGIAGVAALIFLWLISIKWIQSRLDAGLWWRTQQWLGRAMFIVVYLHLFYRKQASWLSWAQGGEQYATLKYLPQASLLAFIIATGVFIVRLLLMVFKKRAALLITSYGVLTILALIAAFWVGWVQYG